MTKATQTKITVTTNTRVRVSSSDAQFVDPKTGGWADNARFNNQWVILTEGTELTLVARSSVPDCYMVVVDFRDPDSEKAPVERVGMILREAQWTKILAAAPQPKVATLKVKVAKAPRADKTTGAK